MYYNFKVKIPDVQGKIIRKKKGNSVYIEFEYDHTYDQVRKFNIPRRAIIGKACPDDVTAMNPNENYFKFFPDAVIPEEREEADRSCCLRIGSYMAIRRVVGEYGLDCILEPLIGKDIGLFMDLCAYSIVTEDNAGQYYPGFAFCHPLFTEGMRIYSDSKISRFLSSLTVEQSVGFLNKWNKGRDHRQRVYISYDSTNKNCQAGDIEFVEFGHPKVDLGLPVLNLSIAFDRSNRVPLFYEDYPGSIADVSQLQFMVDKTYSYGYRSIGFILDRGYFSKENIRYMDACHYDFIMMVKGMKALVCDLILGKKHTFEHDRACFIKPYGIYGTTVVQKLYADDENDRHIHIFHNLALEAAQSHALEKKIESYAKFFSKHEGECIRFGDGYSGYFTLFYDKDGKFLFAKEKAEVIQRELDLCGYFAIVTSARMSAEEALVLYKSRDSSEKLFSGGKSFLGGKSLRVVSSESAAAKTFVEFVALIIRNRIYTLLKDEMFKHEKKSNFMTVPMALKELEKIEMVRRSDGVYRLDHAVSATQKAILSAFGLNEDDVRKTATEIGKLLKNGGSLKETIDEGDDDGEEEDDCIG